MPPARKRPRSTSASSAPSSSDDGATDPVNPPTRPTTPTANDAAQSTRKLLSKEERFNERYKTEQNSNEQVLGTLSSLPKYNSPV